MKQRKNRLAAAAKLALDGNSHIAAKHADAVCTMGQFETFPGGLARR